VTVTNGLPSDRIAESVSADRKSPPAGHLMQINRSWARLLHFATRSVASLDD
jgi:hypothetical protein